MDDQVSPKMNRTKTITATTTSSSSDTDPDDRVDRKIQAVKRLQHQFRKYQHEREKNGLNLSTSARWHEALKDQRLKSTRRASQQQERDRDEDYHSRWQRAGVFTSGLVSSSFPSSTDSDPKLPESSPPRPSKTMDPNYWLEMVDHHHRYGSNLKPYHAFWNTNYQGDQNFFYWLDHGEGRHLDLPDSPRARLDSEKITYLTVEQRLNYLVRVDSQGKLVWAKDSRPVDTARGRHKDLGNGLGIVDATPEEFEAAKLRGEIPSSSGSESSLSSSRRSSLERDAHHYTLARPNDSGLKAKIKSHVDPKAIMDRLLRKTLNANTWIFVADRSGNLYVGVKQTGKFQHSSFLAGSHVLAAGLLRVDQGQLTSLSPLSGHYRAGSEQFKSFVKILEHEWGCDMSRVSISKALCMIGALEKYAKFTKKKSEVTTKIKRFFRSDRERQEDEKEQAQDRPAQLAAQHAQEHEEWKEASRVNRIARLAGDEERQRLEASVGLTGGKLKRSVGLSSLPHEGKRKEDMTDDERIERGAALVARAMARQRKNSPRRSSTVRMT